MAMFKRRRHQRTDYKQRLAMLKSGKARLVVRRANGNFHAQIIVYNEMGDKVLTETFSKELSKFGWLGHSGNTSAAYLTGILIGLKAKKAGVNEAILDLGLQTAIKGCSLFAVAAGAKEAGLKVPLGAEIDKDRISGKHVAKYASIMKKDSEKYKKHFASYLKNNVDPEKLPEHFEQVKKKLLDSFGAKQVMTTSGAIDKKDEEWEDA